MKNNQDLLSHLGEIISFYGKLRGDTFKTFSAMNDNISQLLKESCKQKNRKPHANGANNKNTKILYDKGIDDREKPNKSNNRKDTVKCNVNPDDVNNKNDIDINPNQNPNVNPLHSFDEMMSNSK